MHVKEGRISVPQFNSCDPEGPDVTASVIGRVILLLTGDDLSDKIRTPHISPTGPAGRSQPPSRFLAILILNFSNNKRSVF